MLGILFNLTLGFGLGGIIATSLLLVNSSIPSKHASEISKRQSNQYDFSNTKFSDADRTDWY